MRRMPLSETSFVVATCTVVGDPVRRNDTCTVRDSRSIARRDDRLVLTVTDTGKGLSEDAGTGVGLANIAAQLAALYGGSASLSLGPNSPTGVVATIELPWFVVSPTV